jgi:hypothetical protein
MIDCDKRVKNNEKHDDHAQQIHHKIEDTVIEHRASLQNESFVI